MNKLTLADQIRRHAREKIVQPARRRGDLVLKVVAGDVHRDLKLHGRVPAVCSALASGKFLEENSLILEGRQGPPSGQSTTVVFTYRLDKKRRDTEREGRSSNEPSFEEMRGIAKEIFKSLGGGENFLRRERASFQPPEGDE